MSHIKHLSLENFRIFESKSDFEICPITYFTGTNSSGKSSVLKSILLLKSNSSSSLQVLDFSGAKHNLGTFGNARSNNCEENDLITFGFSVNLNNAEFHIGSFFKEPVTTKRSIYYVLREFQSKANEDIKIELSYRQNDRSGKLSLIKMFLKDNNTPFLILDIGNQKSNVHKLRINYDLISRKKVIKDLLFEDIERRDSKLKKPEENKFYTIPVEFAMQENTQKQFFDEPILVFSKLFELYLRDNLTSVKNYDFHPYILGQPLRRLLKDFASVIENTEYLEAVRANTKRLYTNDSQGTSFNELILDYRSREISSKSKKFLNKWLKKFDIADELIFDNIEGVATTLYLKKGDKRTALADLGYGITQFLPILLKISLEVPILKDSEGLKVVKKLILLEEPETNLHPKFQSLLADFILDAINNFEIRFIIETHSEYIIRRTQLLTAEGKLSTADSVIYYFNHPEEGLENPIDKINISENGSLSGDFGSGFFDEATNLKLELLKQKTK